VSAIKMAALNTSLLPKWPVSDSIEHSPLLFGKASVQYLIILQLPYLNKNNIKKESQFKKTAAS
jgi:hypothetical protein